MVDWLWEGFNAIVLSYGQARAGKTTLLVGDNVPPSSSRSASSPAGGSRRTKEGVGGECDGVGGGGLLRDMLRAIFDLADAPTPTAAAAAESPAREKEQPFSATGMRYDVLNPLAGSWSPSRHSSAGAGDSFDVWNPPAGDPETSLDADDAAASAAAAATRTAEAEIENGCLGRGEGVDGETATALLEQLGAGGRSSENGGGKGHTPRSGVHGVVVALSAWEVSGKEVTDLFLPPPPDSGSSSSSSASMQASNVEAPDRNRRDSSSSNSNNRGIENTGQAAKGGTGGRSRSRNRRGSGGRAAEREQSQGRGAGGGGGGGGGNARGRRRSSRGRSGSDDSTATGGGGWPTGYPEGFLTVRAPSLGTALKLVDTAQGRRNAGEAGERDGRKGGGGGKNAAAARGGAADVATRGHLFFRVVIYNALEETVSTLHVVDLAGGWEVCSHTRREG